MGKWKAIRRDIFKGNMEIELFDLDNDIQEQMNIASKHPEIIKQMETLMEIENTPSLNDRFKIKQLGD